MLVSMRKMPCFSLQKSLASLLSISPVHLSLLEAIKPMSRCIAYLMIKHLSVQEPFTFVAYIITITKIVFFCHILCVWLKNINGHHSSLHCMVNFETLEGQYRLSKSRFLRVTACASFCVLRTYVGIWWEVCPDFPSFPPMTSLGKKTQGLAKGSKSNPKSFLTPSRCVYMYVESQVVSSRCPFPNFPNCGGVARL